MVDRPMVVLRRDVRWRSETKRRHLPQKRERRFSICLPLVLWCSRVPRSAPDDSHGLQQHAVRIVEGRKLEWVQRFLRGEWDQAAKRVLCSLVDRG